MRYFNLSSYPSARCDWTFRRMTDHFVGGVGVIRTHRRNFWFDICHVFWIGHLFLLRQWVHKVWNIWHKVERCLRFSEGNVVSLLNFVHPVKILFWYHNCVSSGFKLSDINRFILIWWGYFFSLSLSIIKRCNSFSLSKNITAPWLTPSVKHALLPSFLIPSLN